MTCWRRSYLSIWRRGGVSPAMSCATGVCGCLLTALLRPHRTGQPHEVLPWGGGGPGRVPLPASTASIPVIWAPVVCWAPPWEGRAPACSLVLGCVCQGQHSPGFSWPWWEMSGKVGSSFGSIARAEVHVYYLMPGWAWLLQGPLAASWTSRLPPWHFCLWMNI